MTGVTPWNAVPLWQVAQPEVIPVWTIVVPEKSVVLVWQVEQSCVRRDVVAGPRDRGDALEALPAMARCAAVSDAGMAHLVARKLVKLEWQVTQSPEVEM